MKLRLATLAALLLILASSTQALATGGEQTALTIAVPPSADLGQTAEVRARLVDASGAGIPKATILFTARLPFLEGESEVVLADARTDADGVATADFALRSAGTIALSAVFQGDERYAPSRASAKVAVSGSEQLYEQTAGVRLPGLNAGPAQIPVFQNGGPAIALVQGTSKLWPALSGWPIAVVLMIIWSLYGTVVVLLFRITNAGRGEGTA